MKSSTSFEERLLSVLESEVERRAANHGSAAGSRGIRRARIAALAGAGALAVAIAVGAPMLLEQEAGGAAWAVQTHANGTVEVQIWELKDPAGLERRLAEAGVPAHIDFVPFGMVCIPRTMLPNHENATDYGLTGTPTGFTIDPGRLPADKRIVLINYPDADGVQGPTFVGISPRDDERCEMRPKP